ncbi:hypothetical protein CYY_000564 [Polysphondylium violaceum]|uniref:Uncharacterized protein n=1 Tax=Polysphondylium violaceum TaxID=133409 RepID=A0A8J4PZH8_9MYCE|nr:hypothetical protein CYY_000564 [Polysphondylium violaceum]
MVTINSISSATMKLLNFICALFICISVVKATYPQNFYYYNSSGIFISEGENSDNPTLVPVSSSYRQLGAITKVDSQNLYAIVISDWNSVDYISIDLSSGETNTIQQIVYSNDITTGPLWGYSLDLKKNVLFSLSPTTAFHIELLINDLETQNQTVLSFGPNGVSGEVASSYDQSTGMYYAMGPYLQQFRLYVCDTNALSCKNSIINGLNYTSQKYDIAAFNGQLFVFSTDNGNVLVHTLNIDTNTLSLRDTIALDDGNVVFVQSKYNFDENNLMVLGTTNGANALTFINIINTNPVEVEGGFSIDQLITSYSLIYVQ